MVMIAKIVKSNSHVDYVGRVIDGMDADEPPLASEYGFGQFVSLPVDTGLDIVGVVYNSQLANPEYGNFGPRLSSARELAVLSPDYLNEQGLLIGILLLGWLSSDGANRNAVHGVPRRVVPVNQAVFALSHERMVDFHRGKDKCLQLHYYSQVMTHAGAFNVVLLESIMDQLMGACSEHEQKRLEVLQQALAWQRTIGGMRL
jgi:hypothetical protein